MLPFEIEGEGAFAGGMGLEGWEGNVGASGVVPLLTVHLSIPLRISVAVKYFFLQQKKKKEREGERQEGKVQQIRIGVLLVKQDSCATYFSYSFFFRIWSQIIDAPK